MWTLSDGFNFPDASDDDTFNVQRMFYPAFRVVPLHLSVCGCPQFNANTCDLSCAMPVQCDCIAKATAERDDTSTRVCARIFAGLTVADAIDEVDAEIDCAARERIFAAGICDVDAQRFHEKQLVAYVVENSDVDLNYEYQQHAIEVRRNAARLEHRQKLDATKDNIMQILRSRPGYVASPPLKPMPWHTTPVERFYVPQVKVELGEPLLRREVTGVVNKEQYIINNRHNFARDDDSADDYIPTSAEYDYGMRISPARLNGITGYYIDERYPF